MNINIIPRSVCNCAYCSNCCLKRHHGNPFFIKPSMDALDQDFEHLDPGAALLAALNRPGGQAQAMRHLKELVDRQVEPLKFVDSDQLSRVVRLGRRVDDFVDLARPNLGSEGWFTGLAEESRLWFAHRVDSKSLSLHVVVVHDLPRIDPVRATAAYCAAELFPRHSGDVESCTVLAQSADAVLWRQVRHGREDIVQVDLVNGLDESIGAIMLMIHPQPDGSPDFPDVQLPQPRRAQRSSLGRQCITFTPLPGGSVRMHVAAQVRFSDERALSELVGASTEAVARLMRPLLSVWPKKFASYVEECHDKIAQEEAFSAHAPFYVVCRGYLNGEAGRRRSSLHKWGFMFSPFSPPEVN